VNGLPVQNKAIKHQLLQDTRTNLKLDYFGMMEVNLNFPQIHPNYQWRERFKTNTHTTNAYNIHSTSTDKRLFGGVGAILSESATIKCIQSGQDPSNLGRWTWTLLLGKAGMKTRIITGYRPIKDYTNRPNSVYSQHETYFASQGKIREPRQAFLEDLGLHIKNWISDDEQIVLGLDLNEDTWDSTTSDAILGWGLQNSLQELHPTNPKPATCNKNGSNTPIDAIWTSPGIDCTAGGMLGFGQLDQGKIDHRLLWLEISEPSIFGYSPSPPAKRSNNSIPLHDPLIRKRVNSIIRQERLSHNLPQKLFGLEKKAQLQQFTVNEAMEYEQLIQLDFGIRQKARKKCVKFYSGKVPYSDVIGLDRNEIHLWNLVVQRLKNRRTDTRKIRRLMKKTKQYDALRLDLEHAEIRQLQCNQRYKQHKKQAVQLREKFQRDVNERRAKLYNTTVETQEKITTSNNLQRHAFRRVKTILNNKPKSQLSTVTYTDSFYEEHECTTQQEIEDACKREGFERYTQVYGTPFVEGSLVQDVGYRAMTTSAQEILDGTYECKHDLDIYTKKLIYELKKPENIIQDSITGQADTKVHIAGWSKMKKSTAASPFGASFTELIAACDDIRVADIDACFAAIPLYSGYCPRAWSRAVDVMIPKKQASRAVTKLRIIVLFDALFNMLNKRIGKEMIAHAEKNDQVPSEAYGSRRGYRAVDCALNKVLVNDIIRQKAMIAALCSNDAKSCYDRIVHAVATLSMRRLGVTKEACHVMFGTLQQVEHHVATTFGTSEEPYTALEFPLQGVGQGNGAGPAIWLVTSIPLINMLRSQGFGFRSTNPIDREHYRIVCFTFVDDTDTIHTPSTPDATVQSLMSEMQNVLNHWEGGLRATGGALFPDKCYWYCISFKWDTVQMKWKYENIKDRPGNLQIRNPDGNYQTLERCEVSEARETLGCWIAMDGNQQAQQKALTKKVERWTAKIRTKQLNTHEAWLSLQSGITKSIGYPLTATSLTKTECHQVMKPLIKYALQALQIPSKFPLQLLFAPKKYLGLAILHLWTEQGLAKIEVCLRHGHASKNSTGKLLRDTMAGMRIELGLPSHPLSYSFKQFHKCVTKTFFHTLWEFSNDNDLILKDSYGTWPDHREHDKFLMLVFANAGYSASELRLLNLCRKSSRIIRLSDLTTGDGKQLHPGWKRRNFKITHNDHLDWPTVGKLTNHCWKFWETAVIRCFVDPVSLPICTLRQPLGKWKIIPDRWEWHTSLDSMRLFWKMGKNSYEEYRPVHHQSSRRTRYRKTTNNCTPSDPIMPTQVYGSKLQPIATGYQAIATSTIEDENNQWWDRTYQEIKNPAALLLGIQKGTAVCVTDGSFKKQKGTAAYIIKESLTADDSFMGVVLTPGSASDQDPYRAELSGVYALIRKTTALAKEHGINGSITLGWDCKSVLRNVFEHSFTKPSQPHYDLLFATQQALRESHLEWKWRYVAAHQDDKRTWEYLDEWERMNVRMDFLAKAYWSVHNELETPYFSLPAKNDWSIWHRGVRLTNWTNQKALELIYEKSTNDYWNKKHECQNNGQPDWDAIEKATKMMPSHQRIWTSKWSSSAIATGKKLFDWKFQLTDACPRCGNSEDHRFHFVQCPAPRARSLWQRKTTKLETWLNNSHTDPGLKKLILLAIYKWYQNAPVTSSDVPEHLHALFDQQSTIGWKHLLDGFWVSKWAEIQQSYFEWIGRRNTGERWLSRLIQKMWEISWDMWRQRQHWAKSDNSKASALIHSYLDQEIKHEIEAQHENPLPSIRRWFTQSATELSSMTIDFKRQWLEAVSILRQQHHEELSG
jgi:hypothetical protein